MSDNSEEEKTRKEFKKRTVKSKAQVEALEEFYNEHKYITESMKEELAKSTGLTEKQVAGWFCHRRLKDKKLTNVEANAIGRPERPNGTAHDPGSGLRQDSCGSTKQEEGRALDLREAESKRLAYQESSAADINYELGSCHVAVAKHSSPEDTSSGSDSSLRNMSLFHQRNHFTGDGSRNEVNNLPPWMKECKPRSGPSGYLKRKGQVENAAITAVKRNLGRLYRTDGPPLGVEFDPIPPGPFGSHITAVYDESHFSEEPALKHSEVSLGQRHHNSGPGYRFDSGMRSHKSEIDGARFKRARGSDHPENYYRENFNIKSPRYSQHDIYQARGSSTDIHEGSVRRARGYESWDVDQKASPDIGKRSLDPISGHNQSHLFDAKVSRKQLKPRLENQYTMRSRVSPSDHYDSSRLNLNSERAVYDDIKVKGLPRRMPKETKRPAEEVAGNEDFDPVQPEFLSKNKMTAAKRVKREHLEDYVSKKPYRKEMTTAAKRVMSEHLEDYGTKIPYQNEMTTAAKRVKGEHREDYGTKTPFRNEKMGWASRVSRHAAEVPYGLKNDDDDDDGDDSEEEEEEEDSDDADDETSSDN